MRLFIRHRKSGEIVSAIKAYVLPEGLEHPYVDLDEDESVLEVEPAPELEQLDAHEIVERYLVDVQAERLEPRDEPPKPRGSRRQRRDR